MALRSSLVPVDDDEGSHRSQSERFKLVYTCKRCSTRNMVNVLRQAWDEGTVISTCQGCNVRHVLSDKKGMLDMGNWTKFSDVENSAEGLIRVQSLDPEELEKLGLRVDAASGNVTLIPRPGDTRTVNKDRVSAVGPDVDPSLLIGGTREVARGFTAVGDGPSGGSSPGREDVFSSPLELDLPDGVEGGDLVQLATGTGIMMVLVPDDAPPNTRLKILGAIEFMVPADQVGEVILLQAPGGEELPVKIPLGATPGSFIQVGYPVIVAPRAPGDFPPPPPPPPPPINAKWE